MIGRLLLSRIFSFIAFLVCFSVLNPAGATHEAATVGAQTFQKTFVSKKKYPDPFNDVDIDVVFSRAGETWRVPTFWRGNHSWSVRFTPPLSPGEYTYRLECSDRTNTALNGHGRSITIGRYTGPNQLLRRGAFKVGANRRYFEHSDGTPYYWLGDTWYTGLSDRLPWKGFQSMTADRKAKGFTAVHLAIMTVSNEEDAPHDPGFCNEGGCIWDADFRQLNPRYFDYADRRIKHLIAAEMAPVIFGAWRQALPQMGLEKMKKLWRYIIARYGAYPVFWVGGGEIYDPPEADRWLSVAEREWRIVRGWTEVIRYIRATDPYKHPLSVHEIPPPFDTSIQDESLTDFDLFQPSHFGWPSIAAEIAQLNFHYARSSVTKPLVVGEIGWERIGGEHLEDFQRTAFWLAMLNGAAGFAYGNAITGESYSADKPMHRERYSFPNWREGMKFPSTAQIGRGANLLRQFSWQRFTPHPEWIVPRGTTILHPSSMVNGFDIDLLGYLLDPAGAAGRHSTEGEPPFSEWNNRHGNFRLPYAAGIAGQVRVMYIPASGFANLAVPTVLDLERDVVYRAYYWEPALGIKIDLGQVQPQPDGERLHQDNFDKAASNWETVPTEHPVGDGPLSVRNASLSVLRGVEEANVMAAVDIRTDGESALILRYQDADNYLAAVYSGERKELYLVLRKAGEPGAPIGLTKVPEIGGTARLKVEARDNIAIVSIEDGATSVATPIVDIVPARSASFPQPGRVGLLYRPDEGLNRFGNFKLYRSTGVAADERLDRELYDAEGGYRGSLKGKNWDSYGKNKAILLDAYRPERPPFPQDWVLILEAKNREQSH